MVYPFGTDGYFNVPTQSGKEFHEAFDRKGSRLAAHEARDVRLLDPEDRAGFGLIQALSFDDPVDLQGEVRLKLLALRIAETEV
jgi:hypothetical protein